MSDLGDDRTQEAEAAASISQMLKAPDELRAITAATDLAAAVLLGYGWWIRALRTSDAIRLLHENQLDHEASPLLRTLSHHAAAIVWLRQDPDEAVAAVSFEHQIRRQKLYQKAHARSWDLSAVTMGSPPSGARTPGAEFLDRFEKLATRIGAPNMYVAYMLESSYAHPSGAGSDVYVDDVEGRVVLRTTSRMPGVPLRQAAVFAGVATRSFGELAGIDALVRLAEEVGDRLGVSTAI